MKPSVIDNAIEYVKDIFEKDFSGHDYYHTMRVYRMACTIAEGEQADMAKVQLAALLHDVDDIKLSPQTHENKDRAQSFLKAHDMSNEMVLSICNIIDEISYVGNDSVVPSTIEGKCVQDADRLDAIGAIGIARAFAYGGNHNRIMYDPDVEPKMNMGEAEYRNHISTTINHFHEKLFKLKDLMNTSTAKSIAWHREKFMEEYVEEFLSEWDGIR
ncbi:MAG: HD domain-containing protein [Clostridiaceae bacterium]|nr:HD domain-containing protein [Clostridiaceae bacterium]